MADLKDLPCDSIGTCTRCGYHGPGPRHDCKAEEGTTMTDHGRFYCVHCGLDMNKNAERFCRDRDGDLCEQREDHKVQTKAYVDEIQPTMKHLVALLNSSGFLTTDSGDGTTNVEAGMEGAMDTPHVIIHVSPSTMVSEADRLLKYVRSLGVKVEEQGAELPYPSAWIEASYDPAHGGAILMLFGQVLLTVVPRDN